MAHNSAKNMTWCRLWHDMPTDPKFRAVAKKAGRSTAEVVAMFTAMMVNASANANERGRLHNWSNEDIAAALDMETEHAEAIFEAMQGKLLDGERLTGWDIRQPKREDGSAERAKAWRERKRTQTTAPDRERDIDTTTSVVVARERAKEAATPPSDFISLMVKAAEPCLDNPVNCQGLLTEATPMMWLENGCDLERDILPTLRAAAITRKGKRISSWSYFTNMVAEAKAKRLAGLPSISIPNQKAKVYTLTPSKHREITDEERERIALEYMQ